MPEESSTGFIDTSLVDEGYPPRVQLSAKYKKGFAYKTIGYRLPVILTKIIDQLSREKNEIGEKFGQEARAELKGIIGKLAKLKNEVQTNKSIQPVPNSVWNEYLAQVAETNFDGKKEDVKWFLSPWLYVECYLYERIHDAFATTTHLNTYDYFKKQKDESFFESVDAACVIGDFVVSATDSPADSLQDTLQSLLEVSLWGNRCDLSMSSGETSSQQTHLLDHLSALKMEILCDDSSQFWKFLGQDQEVEGPKSVGYVLDNAGFEIFSDLCLAHVLLARVERVDFYVKTLPWFISDATVTDFNWILETMAKSDRPVLNDLAKKWKENLSSDRWRIIAEPFWTHPHAFHEMEKADPTLYTKLSTYTTLIFKGDLNYRKLVGDISWEPETPFIEALQGFLPTPLLSLRTCKADTVAGITKPGLAAQVSAQDPDWLITGNYGLIQFAA